MTTDQDRVRLDAIVRGRVQAVGYRLFVARTAAGLGVSGWVANLPDGAVRCIAEGPKTAVAELLTSLRVGPDGARVDRVEETWGSPSGDADGFRIRSHAHPGD